MKNYMLVVHTHAFPFPFLPLSALSSSLLSNSPSPSSSACLSSPLTSHFFLSPLPQVHIFSYQCSQLSTPESVIEVFNTAKRFQKNQDTSKYVSVVVLDEVGLAEDSPNLPLKALHPLLEDGTEGADNMKEVGVVFRPGGSKYEVEWLLGSWKNFSIYRVQEAFTLFFMIS